MKPLSESNSQKYFKPKMPVDISEEFVGICRLALQNQRPVSTEITSSEDFQQLQQVKWIGHLIRRENKDVMKMMVFHNISNNTGKSNES